MILAPGAEAPDFALPNQFGQTVRLSDFRGVKPVAMVFFPFAFSGTCQGELCELRDNLDLFQEAGVELLGVSVDSKHALRAWAEREGYGFSLLADFWPHGEVARAYGAFLEGPGFATRATFLVDEAGSVRAAFASAPGEARPLAAYREALAAL
ncbi:redoxin domain-containing protein [Agromyces sp. CFH 90414]|uniref:Alkyl hydroperoxide reductase E n=1 Tax=Agromyces agglutinans TaxID=2662258 RepID=A0A6I2F1M7_9MICO|nr:peroxiredoxin [Agromyces agglutinans]MRG58344.1 redoxin domain-containing protein [Agromyces agglutinans]